MPCGLIFNDKVRIIVDHCERTKKLLEFRGKMNEMDNHLIKFQNFVETYNTENRVNIRITGDIEGFFKKGRLVKVDFDHLPDGTVVFNGIIEK